MESTDRKDTRPARRLSETNPSEDQTRSENESSEKSEEYQNFENFAKKLGSLTRAELDAIHQKEKENAESKTRHK
jgi:hypothetical protein